MLGAWSETSPPLRYAALETTGMEPAIAVTLEWNLPLQSLEPAIASHTGMEPAFAVTGTCHSSHTGMERDITVAGMEPAIASNTGTEPAIAVTLEWNLTLQEMYTPSFRL